jgi:lipoate-protein ligase A
MYDAALRSTGRDPFRNLALEESLLERGFAFESAVLVYVNDPCVVIGRNQNPWVEVSACSELPVLRRVSGGGAVYQDRGNLNWSILVPRARHDQNVELALIVGALRKLGVEAETGPRGGLFVAADGPWKGAKLSGTARRLSATRVLHHGTLLVDADLCRLSASLSGIEVERSQALPSVRSASVNVSSLVPGLRVEEAALTIARELSGAEPEAAEDVADRSYAEEAALRLASWEWTWGATPAFSLRLDWSGGAARMEIKGGIVAAVSGPGAERITGIAGRRFGYEMAAAAVLALESRPTF